MSDVIYGINENDLANLGVEVLDYVDRISEIFDKIDKTVDSLSNYYNGYTCTELINYYNNDIKSNYKTIKNNIISYSDDFAMLIQKINDNDKEITLLFEQFTDETLAKMKLVDYNK